MRLLLDTHAFLWFIGGDARLSDSARSAIATRDNVVLLSTASLWEIAIKVNIGKLRLPEPYDELLPEQLQKNAITRLDIAWPHLVAYVGLPLHHRDPFDRLLVAQAHAESVPLVSRDVAFDAYGVNRLW